MLASVGTEKKVGETKAKMISCLLHGRGPEKLIYLAAGMFLVRRLAGLDREPSPARENAFRDAIDNAVELMRRLDARFPTADRSR
jgi:hypothetical protein